MLVRKQNLRRGLSGLKGDKQRKGEEPGETLFSRLFSPRRLVAKQVARRLCRAEREKRNLNDLCRLRVN